MLSLTQMNLSKIRFSDYSCDLRKGTNELGHFRCSKKSAPCWPRGPYIGPASSSLSSSPPPSLAWETHAPPPLLLFSSTRPCRVAGLEGRGPAVVFAVVPPRSFEAKSEFWSRRAGFRGHYGCRRIQGQDSPIGVSSRRRSALSLSLCISGPCWATVCAC